jgi:hypothetical protein
VNPITALRKRLATGEAIKGDLNWCRRRLSVLEEWPEPLSLEQHKEAGQLRTWIAEYHDFDREEAA